MSPIISTLSQSFAVGTTFPKIVTNGLVLNLDAGNQNSYNGTGTIWRDLSGNGNNGTLTNGPTYSSANGGSIVFDGTNDTVSIPDVTGVTDFSTSDNYSIDFWVYINSTQNYTATGDNDIIEKWDGFNSYPYVVRYDRPNQRIYGGVYNGTTNPTFGNLQVSTNTWVHICAVFNFSTSTGTLYRNGGELSSSSSISITGTITNNSPLYLMSRGGSNQWVTGRLSGLKIYNRALTANEVSQNFNALRGRFGI